MEGFLLIDKPAGWTSFDVVSYLRAKAAQAMQVPRRSIKVGHAGTLDPFATGLLIVLVGRKYTAQASKLLVGKSYKVSMCLDKASTTGDPEGEIRTIAAGQPPSEAEIRTCLEGFVGQYMQVPPAFSAIKVNGIRAYRLARSNQAVELKPRPVTIEQLELIQYHYPLMTLTASVSSGTYIRVLVEDIAKALGRTAYTTKLVRTAVGSYLLEQAIPLEQVNELNIRSLLKKGKL